MELLTSPKKIYLLEAGLEILHEQSIDWMNEIAFWRDETAFLYSLLVTKTLKSDPADTNDQLKKTENQLIDITGDELNELEKKVKEHEKILSYLVQCQDNEQGNYRETHQNLMQLMDSFHARIKELKKDIFKIVENLKKG